MRTLVRWEPFAELEPMRNTMERLFGEFGRFPSFPNGDTDFGYLPIDVAETADGYEMTASLPGLKPEEVTIQVNSNVITIKGETKTEAEEKTKTWLKLERRRGAFSRSITLPTDLDAEKAKAEFENGVLKLFLPKSEAMKPKSVPVTLKK